MRINKTSSDIPIKNKQHNPIWAIEFIVPVTHRHNWVRCSVKYCEGYGFFCLYTCKWSRKNKLLDFSMISVWDNFTSTVALNVRQ